MLQTQVGVPRVSAVRFLDWNELPRPVPEEVDSAPKHREIEVEAEPMEEDEFESHSPIPCSPPKPGLPASAVPG